MNRNMAVTETGDTSKRRAGNTCWSSEWSFIEDAGGAIQQPAHPTVAKKQPAGNRANANTPPS